jgi:hypothetical protein
MGFIGALPSDIRRVLAAWAAGLRHPVLNVCAGNFTIPAVLRSVGYAGPITACDVTLYTSALGAYLTGRPLDLRLNPGCPDHLADLVDLATPEDAAAGICLLYDLRQVSNMKPPFQDRQVSISPRSWKDLTARMKARLAAFRSRLGRIDYQARDGWELLAEADPSHAVVTAPPIYKGGYEALDKLLRAVLEWTPPPYRPMLDTDPEIYRQIGRFADWAVVLYKDLPDAYEHLGRPSVAAIPKRGAPLRVIFKRPDLKLVLRPQVKSRPVGPFIAPDQPFASGGRLSLARLTLAQSIRLNELFSAARIDNFTGGVNVSLAFTLDGKIFGKADFARTTFQWKFPEGSPPGAMIYLMSDLVLPSAAPRLSKLVLLCLLSAEVKQILDLHFAEDFGCVATTAFSAHPESMKYRGVFKLHKRLPDANGYRLNYYAPFARHSLQEAFALWLKKHATLNLKL